MGNGHAAICKDWRAPGSCIRKGVMWLRLLRGLADTIIPGHAQGHAGLVFFGKKGLLGVWARGCFSKRRYGKGDGL